MTEDIYSLLNAARARHAASPTTKTPSRLATSRPIRSGLFSRRSRLEHQASDAATAAAQPLEQDIYFMLSAARARRAANPTTKTPSRLAISRPLRSGLFSRRSRLEHQASDAATAAAQPLEPQASDAAQAAAQPLEPQASDAASAAAQPLEPQASDATTTLARRAPNYQPTADVHGIFHTIDFIPGSIVPPQRRQRMAPPIDAVFRRWHADCMVANGLIRTATEEEIEFGRTTGATYPHIAVLKQHSNMPADPAAYRFVLDLAALKSRETLKPNSDLPTYRDMAAFCRGKTFFSVIDLQKYYYQVKLDGPSQRHTLHEVDSKKYVYTVCPPGLRNAGATAMRLVRHVLRHHIANGTVEVYMDDIIEGTAGSGSVHYDTCHPRGTGNDVAANTTTNNNNKHKTQADADFTDMSRPCLRTRCRVSEPHNNGGVAECQYCDPSCAQARIRHMRLYEGHAGPGQTPCVPSR
jgi:hypothetical protein